MLAVKPPPRLPTRRLAAIRAGAAALRPLPDAALAARFADLREAAAAATSRRFAFRTRHARTLRESAVACIAEAVRRTTGKTFYDVQLLGGLALADGRVAEMQTGEGKTITTAIGAAVHALHAADGVHVATTNAYLAARDCDELAPPLQALGLTVGLLPDPHRPDEAAAAYACDVTFGTGYDFGFDRLRDEQAAAAQPPPRAGQPYLWTLTGTAQPQPRQVQRGHAVAIIDEADSVLVDEATMPLILAGPGGDPPSRESLRVAAAAAAALRPGRDYLLDASERSLRLTEDGWRVAHAALTNAVRASLARPWSQVVMNALRAALLLERGVDFVVRPNDDGQPSVQIVDPNTGRIHPERTWQDGLHQAVEFRSGVPLTAETRSDGRISRQRYFQAYATLCGLTGTAAPHEFDAFYRLPTEPIPTHRPCVRQTLPLRAFAASDQRDAVVAADIARRAARSARNASTRQPILVGTRTVAHSLRLSERLAAAGVEHAVLNGVQDADEADLIAAAGRSGAVTIATNMAGRGTDIKLDADALAAGGLHVVVAGANLSSRVDRQLAGRAARQGQPGSVCAYVAADDELLAAGRSRAVEALHRCRGEADDRLAEAVARDVLARQAARDRDGFAKRRQMVKADNWRDDVLRTLAGRAEEFDD